jgi:hypothetical protein
VFPDTACFLLGVAAELQMPDLSRAALGDIPQEAVLANNFRVVRLVYENGGDCDHLLSFVAAAFDTLDRKEIQSWPVPLIDRLLMSPMLWIENLQTLVEFLRGIFDWGALPNHRLAKFLPFTVMDDADAGRLLNNPRLNVNTLRYALLRTDPEEALTGDSSK